MSCYGNAGVALRRFSITATVLLNAAATLVACGGDADEGPEPRLSALKSEVFSPSCAFASCHGGQAPEQGLNFGNINREMLVGRASNQVPGRILVIAGDPDSSYLFEKLSQVEPQVGNQMPPKGAGGALPAASIAAVKKWIANGALDD